MKLLSRLSIAVGLSWFLAGCGYTQHTVLPGGITTITVPTFKNAIPAEQIYSYRAGLEMELTTAVIQRFNLGIVVCLLFFVALTQKFFQPLEPVISDQNGFCNLAHLRLQHLL